jgi:hypothetical protein
MGNEMTPDQLRALHAAANGHKLRVVPGTAKIYTDSSPSGYVGVCVWAADAQSFAAAHNNLPAILDRLERADWLITQVLCSIPTRRDWLDPALEGEMRDVKLRREAEAK